MIMRLAFSVMLLLGVLSQISCGGGSAGSSTPTAPSGLSYASPQTYVVGTAIAVLSPTVTGSVNSYAVAPALPAGLALNTTSGQITGTPTATAVSSSYVITATSAGGNTNFSLTISVNPAAPRALSYPSPQMYPTGRAITTLNPTVTGLVAGYTVAPALPAGLSINATSGRISGTPTAAAAQAIYTVTAQNAGGNTTFGLLIAVNAPPVLASFDAGVPGFERYLEIATRRATRLASGT